MTPRRLLNIVHVPVYWLVVGLAVMVVSPILSIVASTRIAENNAAQVIQRQRQSDEMARTESKRLVCTYLASNLDVALETPPPTRAGKAFYAANLDFYNRTGCKPVRTE